MEALFVGIREFLTDEIILLAPESKRTVAEKTKKDLQRFSIPCTINSLQGDVWESMFRKISELSQSLKGKELIINTATGDKITTCAATSAAFVNGLKAFSVANGKAMLLPVLKFSYYKMLSDKKLKILQLLARDKTCCQSLDDLSKKAKMSLPLISYHVNGNFKSDGLLELGLVETQEAKGRTAIGLSMLGRMLIEGLVPYESS